MLNFRTTFVNHKGEVVTNSKDITINYIKTWFFLDLVAALPFDLLELISQLNLMVCNILIKMSQVFFTYSVISTLHTYFVSETYKF